MNFKEHTVRLMLIVSVLSMGVVEIGTAQTITKKFDMNQPGTLLCSSSGGSVTVDAHEKNEVIVQAFVRKKGEVLSPNDSDLEEVLEGFDLIIKKNGTEITAKAHRKNRGKFWNNTGIYFTVIVPHEMSCDVSSSGGSVKISGVEGTHDFSSSGGSVKLENTAGTTTAKSSGGSVSAYKHKGDIKLSSSGGSVTLDKAKGSVYAHSSGGSVKLKNIAGDIDAHSSGGGVYVSGEAPMVKAKSSGGPVKVDISNVSKELHLVSSGGSVDAVIYQGDKLGMNLDLGASGRVNIDLYDFSGKSEKSRIKGTMNNGGIPVYMRASGGSVNVQFED